MMQRLPIRGYKRYECDDMDAFLQARLRGYDEDAPVSWYFVVDMMVPDHLHDMLDLAPARKGEIDGVVKLFPNLGEQTEHRAHLPLLVSSPTIARAWRSPRCTEFGSTSRRAG